MTSADRLAVELRHPGTGRRALIVCSDCWLDDAPVTLPGERYVLMAGSMRRTWVDAKTARTWIDAGASYICAWGTSADDTEEAFDYASFLEEVGIPLQFTLMTTAHANESIKEALWFAFYNANPPSDLAASLDTVVIMVDTPALARMCEEWVLSNHE